MKIAIVVHGRFHAFDLARELLALGHRVILFTNYPKCVVGRFGVPPEHVRSFRLHGILSKLTALLHDRIRLPYPEACLHRMFGRWAAQELKKERWDVIHCWSGISEEILEVSDSAETVNILMRGSSHIRVQARILEEEEKRTNMPLGRPSRWMTAREVREYTLADYIMVLSKFAHASFMEEGTDTKKLLTVGLAAQLGHFRPSLRTIEDREKRIISGEPLRILYIGALSFRKGMWDMAKIVKRLAGPKFRFRLIGTAPKKEKDFLSGLHGLAEFIPQKPRRELPKWYGWGDIFVFPTIEDGYAQVLAEARASGLPILGTTNCAAPDIVVEGKTGWILPVRSPESFIEKLLWCDSKRDRLRKVVRNVYEDSQSRDWRNVAEDFVVSCSNRLKRK